MAEHTPSNRLAADQPTRGADRNQALADQTDPTTEEMLLPQLDDGITLLDVEGGRGVPILLARSRPPPPTTGPPFGSTQTGTQRRQHSRRSPLASGLLDRIHVARGFTAYQHYGAVCDLPTAVNKSIRTSTADSGQPIEGNQVATTTRRLTPRAHRRASRRRPIPCRRYTRRAHAETLHARTLARLATYADGYDIPVLVTRNERNEFTEPVATVADHHLECEQTRMGPRVVGEDFETLVYPVDDGAYYQTTFAYWQQLLAARATQVGVEPTTPAPSTPTPEGVGTGVTADGETVAATADPLLDAWTATGTGGR